MLVPRCDPRCHAAPQPPGCLTRVQGVLFQLHTCPQRGSAGRAPWKFLGVPGTVAVLQGQMPAPYPPLGGSMQGRAVQGMPAALGLLESWQNYAGEARAGVMRLRPRLLDPFQSKALRRLPPAGAVRAEWGPRLRLTPKSVGCRKAFLCGSQGRRAGRQRGRAAGKELQQQTQAEALVEVGAGAVGRAGRAGESAVPLPWGSPPAAKKRGWRGSSAASGVIRGGSALSAFQQSLLRLESEGGSEEQSPAPWSDCGRVWEARTALARGRGSHAHSLQEKTQEQG